MQYSMELKSLLHQRSLNFKLNRQYQHSKHQYPSISKKKSSVLQNSIDINNIDIRYKQLESNYRSIILKAQKKLQIYQLECEQLEKLRKRKIKQSNQILRLKSMLGFLHKVDKATQTTKTVLDKSQIQNTKIEKSTIVDLRQTTHKWNQTPPRRYQFCNMITPPKKQYQKKQLTTSKKINQQISKYKFIPSLALKQ